MGKGRLEAFSDGVIAVAITLLVLDLHVPDPADPGVRGSLADALGRQWPSYVAYVVSFLTIGIIWINHHALLRQLGSVDHSLLLLNVCLLASVVVLPFTTALMAAYLRSGDGETVAAAIYGGSFLLMSLVFTAMQRHVLIAQPQLLADARPVSARRAALRRGATGCLPYAAATAFAPLSPYVTLAVCGAVAVFYALPSVTAAPSD